MLQSGDLTSGSSLSRMYGALLSVNYKYLDRYLFSFNLRADGSSAFGESNRWGLFPSLSAGWRFSKEKFFESFEFLYDAKLRLSWGQSGKALTDPYASYAYYETYDRYMDNSCYNSSTDSIGKFKMGNCHQLECRD
jgi:TonB-dependent starch-binding outer membrane protein SusC